MLSNDALAERSKAVAQDTIPKGRGLEPHRRHFVQRETREECAINILAAIRHYLPSARPQPRRAVYIAGGVACGANGQ